MTQTGAQQRQRSVLKIGHRHRHRPDTVVVNSNVHFIVDDIFEALSVVPVDDASPQRLPMVCNGTIMVILSVAA